MFYWTDEPSKQGIFMPWFVFPSTFVLSQSMILLAEAYSIKLMFHTEILQIFFQDLF